MGVYLCGRCGVDFDAFVRSRSRELLRTAWLLTGDWGVAEDIVQAALIKCWPKWATVTAPDAYVRAAIVRTFLSSRRRRWLGEHPVAAVPEGLPAVDPFPAADVRAAVRAALAVLTPRERSVVVLRYYADVSESETATQLGLSRGAVKRYAADGLGKLREAAALSGFMTDLPEEISG